MNKKKRLLILTAVCATIIVSVVLSLSNPASPSQTQDITQPVHYETIPEESMFVVPESPIGTLGVITAFAVALVLFTLTKKKK